MLESTLQAQCIAHARYRGWWCAKFSSPMQRGVPDYIMIKDGVVLFVEFKKPGGVPTKLQMYKHEEMRVHGADVTVIDDFGRFQVLLMQ
jgi:hypothetical protein